MCENAPDGTETSGGKVAVECAYCGNSFELYPSKAERSERHFCKDSDCYAQWQSENRAGENSCHWRGGMVELKCDWCNGAFETRPGRADEARFCSRQCYGAWSSEHLTGEDATNWRGGGTPSVCAYCGAEFVSRNAAYAASDSEGRFCSMECYASWASENRTGEDHPRWKGGGVYYGDNWYRQRRAALQRDGHECRMCGVTQAQHRDRHGRDLEVHHLMPLRTFDEPEDANTLDNLLTLCRSCHRRAEKMTPLVPPAAD